MNITGSTDRDQRMRKFILDAKHNHAVALVRKGDRAVASALFDEVLAGCMHLLGPDDPMTLIAKNSVGLQRKDQGKPAEAIALLNEVVTSRAKTLGPEHSDTAYAEMNLATVHHELGNLDEARPLYEHAIKASTSNLGAEHVHTLKALANLAILEENSDNIATAMALHEKLVAGYAASFGALHEHALRAKMGRAVLRGRGAKYTVARTGDRVRVFQDREVSRRRTNSVQGWGWERAEAQHCGQIGTVVLVYKPGTPSAGVELEFEDGDRQYYAMGILVDTQVRTITTH